MNNIPYPSFHVARWHRFLVVLMLVLLCGTFINAMPHSTLAPRANSQLLQIAAERPATLLNVIIQKLTHDQSIETKIQDMGGTITRDLPIINGFVAQLYAGTLLQLAYDANIRWISPDAPVVKQSCTTQDCIDPAKLASAYIQTIAADQVWNRASPIRGQGIGVAVVDSGVNSQQDLYTTSTGKNRIVANVAYNAGWNTSIYDAYGHGNHVAGIIAGNGSRSTAVMWASRLRRISSM